MTLLGGHKCTDHVPETRRRVCIVLVGSPIVCLLGSYWSVWKLPSPTSFSSVWWTGGSSLWFPPVPYVYPLMQRPSINGWCFNFHVLCHPELLTMGVSYWLKDSFPRIWMRPQNLSQQCSESSHQMTRFIGRIESYLLSLRLAQILVFISSLDLLIGLFLPLFFLCYFLSLFFTYYWWWWWWWGWWYPVFVKL